MNPIQEVGQMREVDERMNDTEIHNNGNNQPNIMQQDEAPQEFTKRSITILNNVNNIPDEFSEEEIDAFMEHTDVQTNE